MKFPDWFKKRRGLQPVRESTRLYSLLCEVVEPIKVYKKVRENHRLGTRVISLTLLPGALVWVHKHDTKARATFAISHGDGKGFHRPTFVYRKDEVAIPDNCSHNTFIKSGRVCAPGIHFYFNRAQAEAHYA